MKKSLVLFDFDGTLTTRDSLWAFLYFSSSRSKVYFQILKNGFSFFKGALGLMDKGLIKEKVIRGVFAEIPTQTLKELGQKFCDSQLPKLLNTKVYAKLQKHVNDGNEVCIVSASLNFWLTPFSHNNKCQLICTNWDYTQSKFATPNCNHQEKVNRIKSKYNLAEYQTIICFGNSKGDQSMMDLATQQNWV